MYWNVNFPFPLWNRDVSFDGCMLKSILNKPVLQSVCRAVNLSSSPKNGVHATASDEVY